MAHKLRRITQKEWLDDNPWYPISGYIKTKHKKWAKTELTKKFSISITSEMPGCLFFDQIYSNNQMRQLVTWLNIQLGEGKITEVYLAEYYVTRVKRELFRELKDQDIEKTQW